MTLTQLRDGIKAWWPVLTILCGLIVLEDQIDDLKGWAKEINGYTRAIQEQRPQPQLPIQSWRNQDGSLWCCDPNRDDCQRNDAWVRCDY